MTQLRRSIIAVCATTVLAGTGLMTAPAASAAPPPASWKCHTQFYDVPNDYGAYCLNVPHGRQYAVVVNCKIFATGKIRALVGEFRGSGMSSVDKRDCTKLDAVVTTFGARQDEP